MSFTQSAKSAWKILSSDPGVLIGTIQLVVGISELVVRVLNRRKQTSSPDELQEGSSE